MRLFFLGMLFILLGIFVAQNCLISRTEKVIHFDNAKRIAKNRKQLPLTAYAEFILARWLI